MKNWGRWAAALVATIAIHAHAGEVQFRAAMQADIQAAFQRGDYQAIETRYASALSTSARTLSGSAVANVIRVALVPPATGNSTVPGRGDHWDAVERKMQQWTAQYPKSSLAAVALSGAYLAHGWAWRGEGYARTVPREGFQKFGEYVQRAYEALMARESVGRRDPYWYVQMLSVAQYQSWPEGAYQALVRDATRAFPSNSDIYFEIAYRLTPRWGGSTRAIAELADYAVRQSRESEGESLYARIYWAVGDHLDAELSGPEVNWKRIRNGFEDIVRRYPDPWNLNHYARMACLAKDIATTRKVLLRIGDDVEQTAWPDRSTFVRCRQAAGLERRSGP